MVRDHGKDLLTYGVHVPTAQIMLGGEVGEDMYNTLMSSLMLISAENPDHEVLTIKLNSMGGSWDSGMAIYDALKAHNKPVTIEVYGSAMSMATVILQAATKRLAGPNAQIMVHDGHEAFEGKPEDMAAHAKQSKKIQECMYKVYSDASGKTSAYWKKQCKKDCYMTPEEAIKHGLLDGLIVRNS